MVPDRCGVVRSSARWLAVSGSVVAPVPSLPAVVTFGSRNAWSLGLAAARREAILRTVSAWAYRWCAVDEHLRSCASQSAHERLRRSWNSTSRSASSPQARCDPHGRRWATRMSPPRKPFSADAHKVSTFSVASFTLARDHGVVEAATMNTNPNPSPLRSASSAASTTPELRAGAGSLEVPMSYTILHRNGALGTAKFSGTYDSLELAKARADEQARSAQPFMTLDVYEGTPKSFGNKLPFSFVGGAQ
jgi:hypothetical protein